MTIYKFRIAGDLKDQKIHRIDIDPNKKIADVMKDILINLKLNPMIAHQLVWNN